MPATYLDDIVAYHRARAAADPRHWQDRCGLVRYEGPSLLAALRDNGDPHVKVIAEVKRRSPSRGWIDGELDVVTLAQQYQRGGASAISVLTDEPHFSGSTDDLATVRSATALPLLRKDFTVCANDVVDTAALGASTVLLIVAALSDQELESFLDVATQCGLDALVEVHDVEELRRAAAQGAQLIGVNQRNLRTFNVNPQLAGDLASSLAPGIVAVAESGLSSIDDVRRVAAAGFDAVLVGEHFVKAADPQSTVQEFTSVLRTTRA